MTSSESPTNDHLAGSHIWSTMEGGDRRPAVWRIVSRGYGKHLSGRGRSIGYGLYFTDRRVFGVRMRLLAQALLAPYLIVISSLYLLVFFELGSREILFLFLHLVIILADQALRVLSRRFSE